MISFTLRASPMRRAILLEIDHLHRGLRQTSKLSPESGEKNLNRVIIHTFMLFLRKRFCYFYGNDCLLTSRLLNALCMVLRFELAGYCFCFELSQYLSEVVS